MEDHKSQVDENTLVLKKGDIVEVLDSDLPSKWFIRTSWSSSSNSVGWVSPSILERLHSEGAEDAGPPGRLVHASSMPQLSGSEGKFKFGSAKAFGSHDIQSLQVCVGVCGVGVVCYVGKEIVWFEFMSSYCVIWTRACSV